MRRANTEKMRVCELCDDCGSDVYAETFPFIIKQLDAKHGISLLDKLKESGFVMLCAKHKNDLIPMEKRYLYPVHPTDNNKEAICPICCASIKRSEAYQVSSEEEKKQLNICLPLHNFDKFLKGNFDFSICKVHFEKAKKLEIVNQALECDVCDHLGSKFDFYKIGNDAIIGDFIANKFPNVSVNKREKTLSWQMCKSHFPDDVFDFDEESTFRVNTNLISCCSICNGELRREDALLISSMKCAQKLDEMWDGNLMKKLYPRFYVAVCRRHYWIMWKEKQLTPITNPFRNHPDPKISLIDLECEEEIDSGGEGSSSSSDHMPSLVNEYLAKPSKYSHSSLISEKSRKYCTILNKCFFCSRRCDERSHSNKRYAVPRNEHDWAAMSDVLNFSDELKHMLYEHIMRCNQMHYICKEHIQRDYEDRPPTNVKCVLCNGMIRRGSILSFPHILSDQENLMAQLQRKEEDKFQLLKTFIANKDASFCREHAPLYKQGEDSSQCSEIWRRILRIADERDRRKAKGSAAYKWIHDELLPHFSDYVQGHFSQTTKTHSESVDIIARDFKNRTMKLLSDFQQDLSQFQRLEQCREFCSICLVLTNSISHSDLIEVPLNRDGEIILERLKNVCSPEQITSLRDHRDVVSRTLAKHTFRFSNIRSRICAHHLGTVKTTKRPRKVAQSSKIQKHMTKEQERVIGHKHKPTSSATSNSNSDDDVEQASVLATSPGRVGIKEEEIWNEEDEQVGELSSGSNDRLFVPEIKTEDDKEED